MPTSPTRTAGIGARLVGVALAAFLAANDALAELKVYSSPNDDGIDPGEPLEIPEGSPPESLYLYIDSGSQASGSGVVCSDGDGDELCGFEVTVDALGGTSFVEFLPQLGIIYQLNPTRLRANGLFALDPQAIPRRIGELRVQSATAGGAVSLTAGRAIGAALQSASVPQSLLATTPVPEPSAWLQLASAWLTLLWLARHRARRLAGCRSTVSVSRLRDLAALRLWVKGLDQRRRQHDIGW